MTWRLAQSLVVLRDQINAMYPDRNKGTDGALSGYTYGPGEVVVNGNNPSSHNINSQGVVCAFDFTTGDYPGGISVADGMALAEAIRLELKVAPRGLDAYVIHHMEPPYVPYSGPWIADSGSNWEWVAYSGDPHTSHIHVSVDYDILPGQAPSGLCPYDMTDPWNLATVSTQSGTITTIQEDFMATLSDAEKQVLMDAAARINGFLVQRYDANKQPARALDTLDGNQLRQDIAASTARAVAETSSAFHQLQPPLLAIATGVGALKNQPAAAVAPVIDVQALATELAPLLNSANQVEQFIAALRTINFAAK